MLAAVEVLEAHALLLDPGVVTKVEDARALDVRELENVIVGDGVEMTAEGFAGVDLVESIGVPPLLIGARALSRTSRRRRSPLS